MHTREFFVSCSYFTNRRFDANIWHYTFDTTNQLLLIYSDDHSEKFWITAPWILEERTEEDEIDRKEDAKYYG